MVLHHTSLTRGRSAKRRTGSVPLGQLVPPLICAPFPEGLLTASSCFRSSLNTREVSTTHWKGVQGGSGLVLLLFFPMPCTTAETSRLPYLHGQGSSGGKDSEKKRLAYFVLFWGVGNQVRRQRLCPAATHVSKRFLSSISTELCGVRAAAGGWDWIPQEGREAGKCLLTSQETGRVFKKLKWMSVPPEISQKTYHAAF